MVEVLSVALTGANFAFEATSFFDDQGYPPGVGQLLIAIDPEAFARVYDEYLEFVNKMSKDDYFSINDAWGDNMGRTSDGRMVLLDLGNAHLPVFQ